MSELTLHIPPDMENQLRENASKRQESLESYVLELVRKEVLLLSVSSPIGTHVTEKNKKIEAFRHFVKSIQETTKDVPSLRDDAVELMREEQANRHL